VTKSIITEALRYSQSAPTVYKNRERTQMQAISKSRDTLVTQLGKFTLENEPSMT